MILVYGNKYIKNKEHTRLKKISNEKAMFDKVINYLSKIEECMVKKNMQVPNDWYENIEWKLTTR